jgi:S-adenosylmethionine:tRNA ribosyltransferase-isomerase
VRVRVCVCACVCVCVCVHIGLHFSRDVVAAMRARGVIECHLTLHVGAGTFRPMDVASAGEHEMHSEWLSVSHDSLRILRSLLTLVGLF